MTASLVQDIRTALATLSTQTPDPRLKHVTGACLLDIKEAGHWVLAVRDGRIEVSEIDLNSAIQADGALASSAEDFWRMVTRAHNMNVFTAALQGSVTITGNLSFMWSVLRLYL